MADRRPGKERGLTSFASPRAAAAVDVSRPVALRDVVALAVVVLVGVVFPLVLAVAAGAIGVSSGDDWAYMRGAVNLLRSGTLAMPGHSAAAVGQIVLVQPLLWLSGGHAWAYTAFGLSMGLAGLLCAYLLARRFVGTGAALLAVLTLTLFPGFGREVATFMTDVPAFAMEMLCLLLGLTWLDHPEGRGGYLLVSLAAGLLGVSIREFAIAAPAAVVIAGWAKHGRDNRALIVGATGLLSAGTAAVVALALSIPGQGFYGFVNIWTVSYMGPMFATLAAVLLPVLALGVGDRIASMQPEQFVLAAGLVALMLVLPGEALVGQSWMAQGLIGNALLLGSRGPVIGQVAWAASEQLATLAAILLAALVVRWVQGRITSVTSLPQFALRAVGIAASREGLLMLFLILYVAELAVFSALSYPQDRYLYPLVPIAGLLILRVSGRVRLVGRSPAFSQGALAWLAVSAFLIASNSFAYDAARHRAGETAVALGYEAETVDAGYEWVGFHDARDTPAVPHSYGLAWYDDAFAPSRPCAIVSNGPLGVAGFKLIGVNSTAYRQYLLFGPEQSLYLYGSTSSACPTLPRTFADRKTLDGYGYTAVTMRSPLIREASAA